jgi:TRAP-type C4-dicarboxylate transport system substrate-binding protein
MSPKVRPFGKLMVCLVSLVLVVTVLAGAVGCGEDEATPGETITLTFSMMSSPTAANSAVLGEFTFPEIEKRSNGRLIIDPYWSGSLLTGGETLAGVGAGIADMGFLYAAYTPAQLPLNCAPLGAFPTIQLTAADGQEIFGNLVEDWPEMTAELEMWGVRFLGLDSSHNQCIFTTKPIRTLDDFNGLKIRVHSAYMAEAVEAAGATALFLPPGDVADALARGMIDGSTASATTGKAFGWFDYTDYFIETDFATPALITNVINLEVWRSLPSDLQSILEEVFSETSERTVSAYEEGIEAAIAEMEEMGIEIIEFPASEIAKWNALPAVQQIADDTAEELDDDGLPGTIVVDRYGDALEALGKL